MERVVKLAELQQRTKAVESHFYDAMEENRNRSERLSHLLDLMEKRFVRNESEIKRLEGERTRATQENEQLRAMLHTILATIEGDGVNGIGSTMRQMEERIDRLTEMASRVAGGRGDRPPHIALVLSPQKLGNS